MNKKSVFGIISVIIICGLGWSTDAEKTEALTSSHLLITEVYYDTIGNDSVEEWVEIYNPTNSVVDLSNFKIGDEETKGGNEGMYQWPAGSSIEPGEQLVIAKEAMGFYNLYHKFPEFEIDSANDGVGDFSNTPNMIKYTSWSTGSLSLTNTGDEIVLLDTMDNIVDAVVFEGGASTGTVTHGGVNVGESLDRKILNEDSDNCANDFEKIYNPHPGYEWIYEAEDGFTNIGTMTADGSAERGLVMSAETDLTTAGYLFFGPYDDTLSAGMYQANFRMKVNNNSLNEVAAIIDAHNSGGSGTYVYDKILATDFTTVNSWQNFTIWFERKNEGSMEWRVWFNDLVNLKLDNILVSRTDRLIYEAEEMHHQTGSEIIDVNFAGGAGWTVNKSDGINYAIYGPYEGIASGGWTAKLVAKVEDNLADQGVLIFNINNTFGTDEDKNLTVKGTDFEIVNTWQGMDLNFAKSNGGLMEYRVFSLGVTNITVDNIIISRITNVRYEAENMYGSGQIMKDNSTSGGKFRQAITTTSEAGWMVYGPYTKDQMAGEYTAKFHLKTSDNSTDDMLAIVSAYNFGGSGVEEARPIYANDFAQVNAWQDMEVNFTRTADGLMEYRVYFADINDVGVDYVEIIKK